MTVIVRGVDTEKAERLLRTSGMKPIPGFASEIWVDGDGLCEIKYARFLVLGNDAGVRCPFRIYIGDPGERCIRIEAQSSTDIAFILSLINVSSLSFRNRIGC